METHAAPFVAPRRVAHLPEMATPYVVRDLELTPAKLQWLWEKLEKRPSEFSEFEAPDPAAFEAAMFSGDVLWFEMIDPDAPPGPDEALALLTLTTREMDPDASLVITLLDRDAHSKTHVLRRWVADLFTRLPIHRLSVDVPRVHFALRRLVEHAGFTYEGKRRDGARLRGRWVTVNLYGVLRGEVT